MVIQLKIMEWHSSEETNSVHTASQETKHLQQV